MTEIEVGQKVRTKIGQLYEVRQVNDDGTIDVRSWDHNYLDYPDQPAEWFEVVEGL